MNDKTIRVSEVDELIEYYNQCWLDRFKDGHNPKSLAMHMGYFDNESSDNDQAKLNANQFLLQYAGVPKDKEVNILDLGCGIGGTCLYISRHFPLAKVTGVNISIDQIEFAEKMKNKQTSNNVQYLLADYADTSLPSSSFDFVIGIESLCHARNKSKVYQEAHRLLKPNGVFTFMDYFEVRETQSAHQIQMINEFRIGWSVNSYLIDREEDFLEIGFRNFSLASIIDKVMPGIIYSNDKAQKRLTDHPIGKDSEIMKYHLKACIALKSLVDLRIVDYKIAKGQK